MIKYKFNGITTTKRGGCSSCNKRNQVKQATNQMSITLTSGKVLNVKKGDVITVGESDVQMIVRMNKYSTSVVFTRVNE